MEVVRLVVWSVKFAVVFLACLGLVLGPPVYGWILIKRKLT